MYKNKKVIAVIPCLNEERKIVSVVKRIQNMHIQAIDEILIVDDGSSDDSASVAEGLGATVIRLDRVMGVGVALRTGFQYAIRNAYDIVVVLAGNNKDEPEEIPSLLDPIVEKKADFVQGSRFLNKNRVQRNMPFYRRIATRIHPLLFSLCVGKKVTESTNGFRALRVTLLNDRRICLDQSWLDTYELEPYLYYKVITLGYRTYEVPCTKIYPHRTLGYTKMRPFLDWWSILKPMFFLRLGWKS